MSICDRNVKTTLPNLYFNTKHCQWPETTQILMPGSSLEQYRGRRYSMHLEAGFVLKQCHLSPKWTKSTVKSVPSWADSRWKRLCRDTAECVAVCSVAGHYISSGLDATHAEGAWCSELCQSSRQPCSSSAEGMGMVTALQQTISGDTSARSLLKILFSLTCRIAISAVKIFSDNLHTITTDTI